MHRNIGNSFKLKYQLRQVDSVSNVLYGDKIEDGYFGVRLRSYMQQKMKLYYDYNSSPGHIKYLGYSIYATVEQRDSFIADLIAKIKAEVDFFVIWKLSMYERAKVANTIILSNFWRVLRLTSLPKAVIQKLNSIVYYQYIVDERRLQIKKDFFYLE